MKKIEQRILVLSLLCVCFLLVQLVFQLVEIQKATKLTDNRYHQQVAHMLNSFAEDYIEQVKAKLEKDSSCTYIDSTANIDKSLFDSLLMSYVKDGNFSTSYTYEFLPLSDSVVRTIVLEKGTEQDRILVSLPVIREKRLEEAMYLLKFTPNQPVKQSISETWIWPMFSVSSLLLAIVSLIYMSSIVFKQKRRVNSQGDFINSMIHELKTPVSTITVCSKVLKSAGTTVTDMEKIRQYALIVEEENQRIWSCIDSLLHTLTVNKSVLNLNKEELSINEVVRAAVERFSVSAAARQVIFKMKLDESEPAILADKIHIRSVLDNLIDNAIKYSFANAEVSISTEQSGGKVLIVVEDKGRGISSKDQKHIFDKFYRAASLQQDDIKGFGLGLYYVKQVVEAHNGKIFIKSAVNKGTRIGLIV